MKVKRVFRDEIGNDVIQVERDNGLKVEILISEVGPQIGAASVSVYAQYPTGDTVSPIPAYGRFAERIPLP